METNTTTTYHAIRAAARALDIDKRYIEHYVYLKQNKPVLGRYTFKLNLNSDDKSTNLIDEKVQKTSMKVEVTNVDTKEVTIYSSITAAAKPAKKKLIKSCSRSGSHSKKNMSRNNNFTDNNRKIIYILTRG